MPRSKHRRKPGGKAIKNPGRGRTLVLRPEPESPEVAAYSRIQRPFKGAFYEAFPNDAEEHDVEFLADCIVSVMFPRGELTPQPASKQAVFADFTEPFDDTDMPEFGKPHTVEMAELGLAQLVERRLVVVEDDQITLHPRILETATTEAQEPE